MTREGISVGSLIAVSLRSLAAGIYDEVRGLVGLSPHYIAVFGRPGQVAAFTDREWESHLAVFARGPTWRNEFAPRFLFRTPKYVHGTAERIRMPLLVCVAEQDTEANPELAIDMARKAPRGVLKTYAARHFDVYTGDVLRQMLSDQTAFLREHLSVGPAETHGDAAEGQHEAVRDGSHEQVSGDHRSRRTAKRTIAPRIMSEPAGST